ncbi:MAG: hypothetical protein LBE24_02090 [Methylobacillus sp.]|nr:hypothetical protein [Methylobacillus sp.]
MALLAFRGGCPVAEAYLTYLRLHGMQPALILMIDHIGEGSRAQRMRRFLGESLVARLLRWRRNRAARIPAELAVTVQQGWPVTLTPGREPDYQSLAARVLRLTVNSYADPRLLDAMRGCGVGTFLYCSGGRVPAKLFEEGFRILHIHPGVVPFVRGSDGLLWSLLTRGRPGASCFYMDAGIDTGRLIATMEFEPPRWPGLRVMPDNLYRALLYCYDPHLRASLLISVLEQLELGQDLASLDAKVQPHEPWGHYYTMHPELRARTLSRLCT